MNRLRDAARDWWLTERILESPEFRWRDALDSPPLRAGSRAGAHRHKIKFANFSLP